MTDTSPRNPTAAAQRLADALLRTVAGTTVLFRVTGTNIDTSQSELGLTPTLFSEIAISPGLMRRLRPTWKEGDESRWELLLSAAGVETQVNTLDIPSAAALFAMTVSVAVAGRDYLIESIGANEAFGQVYLYRLQLREAHEQAI